MTKPLPSLALDMSQDGIALHQLAFDGHWHELARVALNDPALRARLINMRSIASKLEGRRFKTRIWLPEDQILRGNVNILGNDDRTRLKNAHTEIAAKFGGKPTDYVVQLGKRTEGGAYGVAAVRTRTLQEARSFAHSHGFKARSYSTQSAVEGFTTPPVFLLPADKVKVIGLGLVATTAAAAVLGGGIAFFTLDPLNLWESPPKASDFAPFQRPNPAIERAGAPATPSANAPAPAFPEFAGLNTTSTSGVPPYLPPRQLTAEAQEAVEAPTAPSQDPPPEAPQLASATAVNWPASIAALPSASVADPLPAVGLFSLQTRIAEPQAPEADTAPTPPSGPMPAYRAQPRPTTVANTSFYLEPLPATATRLSPGGLAELMGRTNLTVAQLSRMPAPLLLIENKATKVIPGLPPILPRLRSGRAIPPQVAPPPEPPVAAPPAGPAPLFTLVSGRPDITPPLRPAPPAAETPPAADNTDAATPDNAETTVAEAPISPAEADNASLAAAVDAAIDSAASAPPQLFTLLEGQPALLPRLRSGAEIPVAAPPAPVVDPAFAEANALRPLRRPQNIIQMLDPLDTIISGAAPASATRPSHRGDSFAANAARIIAISTSQPRVTPRTVPNDPQSVNLPTSASVARAATIENGINLRKTNLLGIFGTADNRTALIRLSGGRNIRVQRGQSFSGWTVVAIGEDTVRIRKRNREEILRMPAE